MSFETLRTTWEKLGEIDPFWAILSNPEMENNRWELEQFFRSGRLEIEHALNEIQYLGFSLRFGRALDFGCGVGRNTQALASYFERVDGVDIALPMIQRANQLNSSGNKIRFSTNQRPDLTLFENETFDFIYSRIVLQHMNPVFAKKYLSEFIRILHPGGLLAFQALVGPATQESPAPIVEPYLRQSGFCSALIETDSKPLILRPNQDRIVSVRVKNTSQMVWNALRESSGQHEVLLGNHWLLPNGSLLKLDDGRTSIPRMMSPQDEVILDLLIRAPETAGNYVLELDIVREQVAWFSEKGNKTVRIPVTVEPPIDSHTESEVRGSPVRAWFSSIRSAVSRKHAQQTPAPNDKPQFEMHGIPVAEVFTTIEESGARIFAIQTDGSAGPAWRSFFYYAAK